MRQGIFLPESTFSADTLTVSAYSTGVQARASTCVRTLTIPNTGSHIIVWTHENTPHTDRMGIYSAALAATVPYAGKVTQFPARDKEVLK